MIRNERSIKLVSIKNQHAPHDRNGFDLYAIKESLHIVNIIVIISFIVVPVSYTHLTLPTILRV